jgi:hypothetical protein
VVEKDVRIKINYLDSYKVFNPDSEELTYCSIFLFNLVTEKTKSKDLFVIK